MDIEGAAFNNSWMPRSPFLKEVHTMALTTPKRMKHFGDSAGMAYHDHDLVHELSKRLDCLWRCDQYIANAEGHDELQDFWETIKEQEKHNVDRLRSLIRGEIDRGCF
jgi:hypothetical protein